jgi:excisionase family DNA binding protein
MTKQVNQFHPTRAAYPISEVGDLLGGISRGSVYKLIAENALTTFKVGRRRFCSSEAINQFIRSREPA